MPRRGAVALLLTTAALALLLAFKTPSDPATGTAGETGTAAGAAPSPVAARPGATAAPTDPAAGEAAPGTDATPAPEATPTPDPAAGVAWRDGTVTGTVVGTRWGAVQVQVTIAGGAIADVAALQLPDGDRHSAQLSQRAEPQLRSSALAVQGAGVDIVSGATYTSLAYAQSLQAALDAARA
jgi:uncharacterized protein with FMN-binding domain